MNFFKGLIPIVGELRVIIRHIVGMGLRKIADHLLWDYSEAQPAETKPTVSTQEADPSPTKVRDRSNYDPMKHGSVPSALYGALKVLLEKPKGYSMTVNQLLEEFEATDSTLRKGLKIMTERGVIGQTGSPTEFFILYRDGAVTQVKEFEDRGVPLYLKQRGEADTSLH
jgi:hypothetical protein